MSCEERFVSSEHNLLTLLLLSKMLKTHLFWNIKIAYHLTIKHPVMFYFYAIFKLFVLCYYALNWDWPVLTMRKFFYIREQQCWAPRILCMGMAQHMLPGTQQFCPYSYINGAGIYADLIALASGSTPKKRSKARTQSRSWRMAF